MNKEDEDKIEKMDEMLAMAGKPALERISKIAGRDLTDEEKKQFSTNLKAFFMFSILLLKATL